MKVTFSMIAALVLASSLALADDAVPALTAATDTPTAEPAVVVVESPAADTGAASGTEIGKPAAGKGQIVFFRPSKMTGAMIGFKVREEGKELGVLKNGNYFVLAIEPGKHQYTVHSEAKDVLTLEVDAGEVYYVQGAITMGLLAGRPNLTPSTAAAFSEVQAKLKQSSL